MLKKKSEDKAQFIYKHIYGEGQIELFKHEICQIKWNRTIKIRGISKTAYESFFHINLETNGKYFPKIKIKLKAKTIQNSWITKGITKSFKRTLQN